MNYLQKLKEIDDEVYKNMGKVSQKVIDIIEDTLDHLDRDVEEEPIERDELGAINYEIDVLLEIWKPELKYDIEILTKFDKVIKEWGDDIDFINTTLGIPRHRG